MSAKKAASRAKLYVSYSQLTIESERIAERARQFVSRGPVLSSSITAAHCGDPQPWRQAKPVPPPEPPREVPDARAWFPVVEQPAKPWDEETGVALIHLKYNSCRWPVAGEGADMRYCGEPITEARTPYCPHHHKLAVAR